MTIVQLPAVVAAPTPCATASMSPAECVAHRTAIAFEVEIVLAGYWQADMAPELRAAVLADWADELEDWHVEQVRWGLRQWRRDHPRLRPNPGDVLRVLMDKRGRVEAERARARVMQEAAPSPAPSPEDEARMAAQRQAVADVMAGLAAPLRERAHERMEPEA